MVKMEKVLALMHPIIRDDEIIDAYATGLLYTGGNRRDYVGNINFEKYYSFHDGYGIFVATNQRLIFFKQKGWFGGYFLFTSYPWEKLRTLDYDHHDVICYDSNKRKRIRINGLGACNGLKKSRDFAELLGSHDAWVD